jgi:hypothetical protein
MKKRLVQHYGVRAIELPVEFSGEEIFYQRVHSIEFAIVVLAVAMNSAG